MSDEQITSLELVSNKSLALSSGEGSSVGGGAIVVDNVDGEGSSVGGGGNGPVCRFKGVVPQQNGHWGAQIYANHQRIWLGTFKTERDAAMAYDSASIKLRSNDTFRNIPASATKLALEANFQSYYSNDVVLMMIKDGSYQLKFSEFCNTSPSYSEFGPVSGVMRPGPRDGIVYTEHFEKELTPSDVGKLNRLVIPKKYAVKFFPQVCQADPEIFVNGSFAETGDSELDFFDTAMRRWTFRYCYWKSSQSFVFTKGWNKFVKEKGLKTKDTVIFYGCEMLVQNGNGNEVRKFSMIDVRPYEPQGNEGGGVAADLKPGEEEDMETEGTDAVKPREEEMAEAEEQQQAGEAGEGEMNDEQQEENQRRGIRLFGVEIID